MVIKAKSPKRRISVIVPPNELGRFQKQLFEMQQASIFKQILEERKKAKKAKQPAAETKPVKATRILKDKDRPKNRDERRKELRKARRKEIMAKVKLEKLALQKED